MTRETTTTVHEPRLDAWSLGATIYMPVIHPLVSDVISGRRFSEVRSVVLCLEDALSDADVQRGLRTLRALLSGSRPTHGPRVFVRPRGIDMAQRIQRFEGIVWVDGFVAPKVRTDELGAWLEIVEEADLLLMPTLESAWLFDPHELAGFVATLEASDTSRILALRVGGNDLLATLGQRRPYGCTLYEGPLGWLLSELACRLGSRGYALSAPVFDRIDDHETLARECRRDVEYGFVGKTAIHPSQVPVIQRAFAVSDSDERAARRILAPIASAVSRFEGAMLEPATHGAWARRTLERLAAYGRSGDTTRCDREADSALRVASGMA